MRLLTYSLLFACFVGGLSSCGEDEMKTSYSEDPSKSAETWDVPSYVAVDEDMGHLRPERYLGRGFDFTQYAYNDVEGFRSAEVLDLSAGVWSPFGRAMKRKS